MSLFVLREGFKVVTTPAGAGRLVHVRTGAELEVSTEDAKMLERLGTGGLEATDPWLTDIVERFRALRLLVPAASVSVPAHGPSAIPASAAASGSTGGVGAGQAVPCLRPTLKVNTKGPSSSLVNVTDPATGKTFQLYDFEVSLARMLDGRRSHSEVVEAARHIGLPVTFDSLVRFIRELEKYGFLAPPGTVTGGPAEPSLWPAREPWDEATRALYQSGLRMHRQGRYHESAAYFEAMLVQDPKNAEARQMLDQAKQRASLPPEAGLTPLPDLGDQPIEQFDELSLDDAPAVAAVASVAVSVDEPVARPSRRRMAIALAGGLVALGALAWNFAGSSTPAPEVVPAAAVPAAAVPAAVVPAAAVPAAAVPAAAVPAAAVPAAVVPAAEVPAAAVPVVNSAAVPAAPSAVPAEPVRDAAAAAPGPFDAGTVAISVEEPRDAKAADPGASGRAWEVFPINKRGRVKMGQVVAPAAGIVSWKTAAEQRVKRGDLVAVVRTAEGEQRLTAPVAGLMIRTIAEGENAQADQSLGDLLYPEAYLQTIVTGARPDASWVCEVVDEASNQRADCTVGAVVPRGAAFFVTAILLPRWFDGAANAKVRLAAP